VEMHSDSLEAIPTRLATEGQELAVHTFLDGSIGFAAPQDVRRLRKQRPGQTGLKGSIGRLIQRLQQFCRTTRAVPAIYVPNSTRLILKGVPPVIQAKYGVQREEGAALIETQGSPGWLRFANGRQIFLRDLPDGMLVEVLSLAETDYAMCDQDMAVHA
jgi:hypothetical protein